MKDQKNIVEMLYTYIFLLEPLWSRYIHIFFVRFCHKLFISILLYFFFALFMSTEWALLLLLFLVEFEYFYFVCGFVSYFFCYCYCLLSSDILWLVFWLVASCRAPYTGDILCFFVIFNSAKKAGIVKYTGLAKSNYNCGTWLLPLCE